MLALCYAIYDWKIYVNVYEFIINSKIDKELRACLFMPRSI